MELRQLRYFEALGSTLNFSRAAELLHIAQPPLTRQIQQLEEELGVLLVDRSKRPLRLTRAGGFFYDKAIQILSQIDEISLATKQIGEEKKPSVRVGFVPSVLYGDIPRFIHLFTQKFADIDIVLSELTSVQQVQSLQVGRIDVGFGRLPIQQDGVVNTLIHEEPLVAALPSSDNEGEDGITLKALSQKRLIIYPAAPRPSFADQVLSLFRMHGLSLIKTIDANGLQTAIGLVATGMGTTIVPKSVSVLRQDDIKYARILDEGAITPLLMSTRKYNNSDETSLFVSEFNRFRGKPG